MSRPRFREAAKTETTRSGRGGARPADSGIAYVDHAFSITDEDDLVGGTAGGRPSGAPVTEIAFAVPSMATGGAGLPAQAYASRPCTALPTTFSIAFYSSIMVGSDRLQYSAPPQAAVVSSAAAGATGELYNDLQMSRFAAHQQLLGHMELSATSRSIMWLPPCYFVLGAAEVFTSIGMLEFFYDQSPGSMKNLAVALAQLTVAGENYLNSALLGAVPSATGGSRTTSTKTTSTTSFGSWLCSQRLSALNLLQFVYCSTRYQR